MSELRTIAMEHKAWPYEEARRLIKRYPDGKSAKDGKVVPIVFETGYGPSGLPHLGTFQEVARTLMVRHALTELTGWEGKVIAFSDDMDGLRKVPPNLPQSDMMHEHIDQPLCKIPDPFGCHDSYADHNNAMLRKFLDDFDFDYEFVASHERYFGGDFDEQLVNVLRNYDKIMAVMLPTLGAERQQSYSPVLPISSESGKVLQVPIEVIDAAAGMIAFADPDAGRVEHCILAGGCKLQWKVDWAMRWVALGVDYEMYGKDLTDSGVLSGRIAKILGGRKPEGMVYEMYLDEEGQKVSKSKGNGLTIEEWLTYAPQESLSFYIYRDPQKAKQLSFQIIPKAVDEYYRFLAAYPDQEMKERLGNPAHHIHAGDPPSADMPIDFAMLLNLVGVANTDDKDLLWGFVQSYAPDAAPESHPALDRLIDFALVYFRDFVQQSLFRRAPDAKETAALRDLDARLAAMEDESDAETIQNAVFEVGKAHGFEPLRDWFKALYETLLGSTHGPRMGSFAALYGIDNVRKLIGEALERSE